MTTPEKKLSTIDQRIRSTQDRFLEAYERCGTIKTAAKCAGIHRDRIYDWQHQDKLGFKGRFEAAKETFRESLEEIMFERLRDPKTHPVLLIFCLKSHWKEKYGDAAVSSDDTAKEVMADWRRWQKEQRELEKGTLLDHNTEVMQTNDSVPDQHTEDWREIMKAHPRWRK